MELCTGRWRLGGASFFFPEPEPLGWNLPPPLFYFSLQPNRVQPSLASPLTLPDLTLAPDLGLLPLSLSRAGRIFFVAHATHQLEAKAAAVAWAVSGRFGLAGALGVLAAAPFSAGVFGAVVVAAGVGHQ
jgi:hypothetical protein